MSENRNPNKLTETGRLNYRDTQITDDEADAAEAAIQEEEETGSTDKRCKRCGTRYLFHPAGNSYTITCETAHCFQMIARGI